MITRGNMTVMCTFVFETLCLRIDKLMDILSSEDEQINEEELRKSRELYEEEKMLTKEIHDLEQAEIEVD